jgi:hypothetical protein
MAKKRGGLKKQLLLLIFQNCGKNKEVHPQVENVEITKIVAERTTNKWIY